ncbi:hypothetical protein WJ84_01360 [Burkholderia ubonensis]|nr:hypothetical protein WJ84_01360 [Burkholderia ubonensis]KVP39926.1 hypothetical protein WJ87_07010 [Burkholderia ubonensis]
MIALHARASTGLRLTTMNAISFLTSSYREATYTAVLALVLLCLASGAAWVMSRNQSRETQRFWQLTFRHIAAICFMFGLGFIWKTELQSVFLALGAATAGFLLAFRESWLSLLAFWLRVIKRQYSLNDFIEVDGVRGKVIDITWMTTIVAESVPGKGGTIYSGKVVHIPNNRMLLEPLTVDNLTDEYTLHIMTLPLPKGARPLAVEKVLLEVANRHCAPYFKEARKHMKLLEQEKALEIASVEPRTFLSVGEEGAVTIRMRITVPQADSGRLHQAILHEFFEKVDEKAWPLVP